ncbi:MAG TPA: phosphodiester glycosidase family protein [Candidatus Sumerlaeota bacterium]|nr:MAG: hypothetical protein BWY12_01110 [candidate division BRC1 bacterium ADurb.Bin183]HOE63968.1 phosphodiester glycosidase family protein [Candidatus Sumerlaeota bacterium]HRR32066.1 phosphodiester glycosidase family protein [Candidatus Sumerlaeia bacterium]HON50794.1 phosphodiester glycosidase family protein [Candidatus Sumerlaeota bacterium]HOR65488.1 phosphodiester glycosidase family protein [Candidatus Sumerlaeota bacterium]
MMHKLSSTICIILFIILLNPIVSNAEKSLSLKACYPNNTALLPEAVDSEAAEGAEIFPGIVCQKAHVWSINGPLMIYLIYADANIVQVEVEFKKLSSTEKKPLCQMGETGATIAAASLMPSIAIAPKTINITDLPQTLADAPPLIKNGKSAFDMNSSSIKSESLMSLCGAGFIEGGKRFVIVVVDGRQPNHSIGMNAGQLTEYMLFLGCSEAYLLNKDDTAALATRNYGEQNLSLFNSPQGGSEPAISSAMLITNRNPKGKPFRLVSNPASIDILSGKTIPIRATLIDKYNNILSTENADIKIKPASLGEMLGGSFKSGASTRSGTINIAMKGAKTRISARVLGTLKEIRLDRDSISLLPGEEVFLMLTGIAPDGSMLSIPSEHAEWTADSSCGIFSASGCFKAGKNSASGFIEASAAGARCRIPLVVGEEIKTISDFNVGGEWKVKTSSPRIAGSMDITVAKMEEEKKVVGWMRFEIEKGAEKTSMDIQRTIPLAAEPRKIGLSIKGAVRNCSLYGYFVDSFEHEHSLLFSTNIEFADWSRLVAEIPKGVAYPIVWKRFSLESPPNDNKISGTLFLQGFETISAPALPPRSDNDYQIGEPPSWLERELIAKNLPKVSASFFAFGNANISKGDDVGSLSFKLLEYLKKRGGDFALSTGNLTSDGMGETLGAARSRLLNLSIKFYNTLGFNEKCKDPSLLNYASIMFPTHYSVSTGDINLIVLDNTAGGFTLSDPQQTPREAQWAWLLQEMRQTRANTLIFSCHVCPMGSVVDGYNGAMNSVEAETFHKLLLREKNKGRRVLVLSGNHFGFRMIVRDGIPYITTGGGDGFLGNVSNEGDICHYLEFNVTRNKIIYAIRPLFNRLSCIMNPPNKEVKIGDEIEFSALGIIDIPARKIKREVPLRDPFSYQWQVSNKSLGTINGRSGKFEALAAGNVEISITTGDMEAVEKIVILEPSK